MTERILAEGRIAEMRAELHRRAIDAEAASRAKSGFLRNVSHELRTPMNAIIGLTHLLGRSRLDDNQRDRIAKIQAVSDGLLALIDDILNYVSIDQGEVTVDRRTYEVAGLLSSSLDRVRDRAALKALNLRMELAPGVPRFVHADRNLVAQALHKLVDNAVKFTTAGEVVLRAEPAGRDGDLVELKFVVTDTGIGVDERARAKLFDPFTQADESLTRSYGGTGMGLALARRIVERLRGRIGVDSRAGDGSRF